MSHTQIGTKLNEFIAKQEHVLSANLGLLDVFQHVIAATKNISEIVNHAGLVNILGKANKENVQGEEVMKLDEISNDFLIDELRKSIYCAGVASEEMEEILPFDHATTVDAQYIVMFDPLDGSGNIDTNASIGTIFSIQKRISNGELLTSDFLQKGHDVLISGYAIYGSSTMLVYYAGDKVQGFTLEQKMNEYCLSHFDIRIPKIFNQFSINYGNHSVFNQQVLDFVKWCSEDDKSTKRPYSLRYIGTMVADVHRILVKGGIFMYPYMTTAPKGKLRLMYECIPLGLLVEKAGGLSTNDEISILDMIPTELHQRTPVVMGSQDLVERYMSFK
jgi:fructose-1,6-bisphosphatase I